MSNTSLTRINTIAATPALVLRAAGPADLPAIQRLAERDSAPAPRGELLVAEAGGELVAALELDGARVLADPFRRTAEAVDLLQARAAQLRDRRRRPLRLLARTPAASGRGLSRAAA